MLYHLVVKDGLVVAVSSNHIVNSTGAVFTKEYLRGFDIFLSDEDEYKTVANEYTLLRYDEVNAVIIEEPNTDAIAETEKLIKSMGLGSDIVSGFTVSINMQDRHFGCDFDDQLTLHQALFLLNNGEKSVDIKCTINGVKKFVPHDLTEGTKVMKAMCLHILNTRKELTKN